MFRFVLLIAVQVECLGSFSLPINNLYFVCRTLSKTVCRQIFWNQMRLKLRESLAHLIGFIMQRVACDASAAFRVSFV